MSTTRLSIEIKPSEEQRKLKVKRLADFSKLVGKGLYLEDDHGIIVVKLPRKIETRIEGTYYISKADFDMIFDTIALELQKVGYNLHSLSPDELSIHEDSVEVYAFSHYYVETEAEKEARLKREEAARKRKQAQIEKELAKDKELLKNILQKHGRDIIDEV